MPKTDPKESEVEFRRKLIRRFQDHAMLFDLVYSQITDGKNKGDYDALVWKNDFALFIEYKNSIKAYKGYKAHNAQQWKDVAKNIAKELGFAMYDAVIVVNGDEMIGEREKGGVRVVPLSELSNLQIEKDTTG